MNWLGAMTKRLCSYCKSITMHTQGVNEEGQTTIVFVCTMCGQTQIWPFERELLPEFLRSGKLTKG